MAQPEYGEEGWLSRSMGKRGGSARVWGRGVAQPEYAKRGGSARVREDGWFSQSMGRGMAQLEYGEDGWFSQSMGKRGGSARVWGRGMAQPE